MANIFLELEPQTKASLSRVWMIPVGFGSIVQALFSQTGFRHFDLAFGVLMIVGGFYYWKIYKPKIVTFDEIGVEGKIRHGTIIELKWEELSRIEDSTYEIVLITKTAQRFVLNLSNITFQQHREVKPKIFELAKSKGVQVVAG